MLFPNKVNEKPTAFVGGRGCDKLWTIIGNLEEVPGFGVFITLEMTVSVAAMPNKMNNFVSNETPELFLVVLSWSISTKSFSSVGEISFSDAPPPPTPLTTIPTLLLHSKFQISESKGEENNCFFLYKQTFKIEHWPQKVTPAAE